MADRTGAFPGSGNLSPADSELADLRRQLQRVTAERDILKKAIAICSREQK
jgi:transposase